MRTILTDSFKIAQIIWIHVPSERPQDMTHTGILRATLEKRTIINVIQAFSVSMKHFLRAEPGIYYEDLYPLVCFLPRYITGPSQPNDPRARTSVHEGPGRLPDDELPLWYRSIPPKVHRKPTRQKTFDPEKVLPTIPSEVPLGPARNPPKLTFWVYFPFLIPFRWLAKVVSQRFRRKLADEATTVLGTARKPAHVESNVPLEIT
jgi:ion channel-forming bestrophin family protein